ncbi:endolytic transglycosylase MltG [Paeniglutamicibacter sp.]|uniref:endolytic transglycosylase MltG n=1 Tax=Paeniglutamicibacter sp. TaxID=1934391 RepID=UPI003989E9DF
MTNESFNDSPRHESGVSPRRAARAAREKAEHKRNAAQPPAQEASLQQPPEGDPGPANEADGTQSASELPARHGSAHHYAAIPDAAEASVPGVDDAAKTEAALKASAKAVAAEEARILAAVERTKALDEAQRARTQSAQRARKEAIEAQRAAAERVRQTLRANAAPLRDRSAAARSATTTNSTPPALQAAERNPVGPAGTPPFDQDARRELTADEAISSVPVVAPVKVPDSAGTRVAPPLPSKPPVVNAAPVPAPTETKPATMAGTMAASAGPTATAASPVLKTSGPFPIPAVTAPAGKPRQPAGAPAAPDNGLARESTAPSHEAEDFHHHEADHLPVAPHEGTHRASMAHPTDPHASFERQNLFLTSTATDRQARKARRRRRNWVVLAVLLGFCAVIFGIVIFLQGVMDRLSPQDFPAPGGEAVTFEVESGWGPQLIGRELESRDIVASDKLFLEAIQLVETESREIHPGTYELRREMPALDAAQILIGEPAAKVSYVAIKQNTRMNQVLEDIATATGLSANELAALSEDPAAFGITTEVANLEGYLHPGEYRFPLDVDAKTVLKTMVDATLKTLTDNGITDANQQYHVLQVASILQAEARQNDYGTVAGALENRLHPSNTETNGLLQVDSTVIYGLDRYTLQMTETEKKDAGNAYNTYIHKGLPPTPIGSPGDPAIQAAAHPTPNDFYYWVTVNTNSGETKFAKTYAEHLVNQNEFRAWCAANTDVCK